MLPAMVMARRMPSMEEAMEVVRGAAYLGDFNAASRGGGRVDKAMDDGRPSKSMFVGASERGRK